MPLPEDGAPRDGDIPATPGPDLSSIQLALESLPADFRKLCKFNAWGVAADSLQTINAIFTELSVLLEDLNTSSHSVDLTQLSDYLSKIKPYEDYLAEQIEAYNRIHSDHLLDRENTLTLLLNLPQVVLMNQAVARVRDFTLADPGDLENTENSVSLHQSLLALKGLCTEAVSTTQHPDDVRGVRAFMVQNLSQLF